MTKHIFTTFLVLLFVVAAFAQQYPRAVLPGEKYVVQPANDTLWILTNSQANKALIAAKNYKICQQEIDIYKKQVENLKQQIVEKDSIIRDTKQMMEKYRSSFEECNDGIKVVAKRYERCKRTQKLYLISGVAVSVITFFIGAIYF